MLKIKSNSSVSTNIRWGIVLNYISMAVSVLVSIVYTPIMLNILGQSEHGLYSTVSSAMSWLGLLELGISSSYLRYFAKYKNENDEDSLAAFNALFLLIFVVIGFITLVCGTIITQNLHLIFKNGMTNAEYKTAFVLSVLITIEMSIGFPLGIFGSIISANEKFIYLKIVSLLQNIITPVCTIPLLIFGWGSIGIVIATMLINVFVYGSNIFYCHRRLKLKFDFHHIKIETLKGIFGYSFFIALNLVLEQFATGLDRIFTTRYVSTAEASVYSIGCSLYTYFISLSGAIAGLFSTRVFEITEKYKIDRLTLREKLTEQFVKLGRIQFYIEGLLLTGIIFFGRQFIHIWAEQKGQNYGNSYYVAVILCSAAFIPISQKIGISIQRAQNMHRYRTLFFGISTVINIVVTILLCRKYGAIGAAIGTAISMIVVDGVFMNIFYDRYLNVSIISYWSNILRITVGLIPSLIVGVIIIKTGIFTSVPMFLLGVSIYVLIYIVSMYYISFNTYEKNIVRSVLRRTNK